MTILTVEKMIEQAVAAEKAGTLKTFWRPTDKAAIAVCKIEGHQWQRSPHGDALACDRCAWAIAPEGGFKR